MLGPVRFVPRSERLELNVPEETEEGMRLYYYAPPDEAKELLATRLFVGYTDPDTEELPDSQQRVGVQLLETGPKHDDNEGWWVITVDLAGVTLEELAPFEKKVPPTGGGRGREWWVPAPLVNERGSIVEGQETWKAVKNRPVAETRRKG
jgi:hypothetical protein